MFNLTLQERGVILFLIIIFLLGMGTNFLIKKYPQIKSINYEVKRIDLNQADKLELLDIPGIGEKLAQRIVEFRNLNGEFVDIEELRQIKGIGQYKYGLIKDYFLVE